MSHLVSPSSTPVLSNNPTYPPIMISDFKSNWELLTALPAPADMMKIAPYLPTSYFTPSMLDAILPNRESLPLVSPVESDVVVTNNPL